MAGKGSLPRPFSVDVETYTNNWQQAFTKSSSRPYLVAINPWYKIYYDAQNQKTEKILLKTHI